MLNFSHKYSLLPKKNPTRNYCGQNNRDWYIFFLKRIKRNYLLLYPLKRSLPLFKTRYTLCFYSHCELLKFPTCQKFPSNEYRTSSICFRSSLLYFLIECYFDSSILFSHAEIFFRSFTRGRIEIFFRKLNDMLLK